MQPYKKNSVNPPSYNLPVQVRFYSAASVEESTINSSIVKDPYKQMKKSNVQFEAGIWIKFIFNNAVCVGRTFSDNGMLMVSYTDENAQQNQLPVCLLSEVVRLTFVKNISSKPRTIIGKQPGFETSIVSSERCGSFTVKIGTN